MERQDPRAREQALTFTDDDMKEIMNAWKEDHSSWMAPENLEKIEWLTTPQEIHQFKRSRFSAMLFEIFGNKTFVDLCIRFPLSSAAQPAESILKFVEGWVDYTNSDVASKARSHPQP